MLKPRLKREGFVSAVTEVTEVTFNEAFQVVCPCLIALSTFSELGLEIRL